MIHLEHVNLVVTDVDAELAFYQAAFPHWRVREREQGSWYGKPRTWVHFGDDYQYLVFGDGTVSALIAGDTEPTQLGRLELARFANPAGLVSLGNNLATPSEASGDPETGNPQDTGFGGLSQGFLESSNVNIAEELVQMILAQRAFEVNSRVIQAGDEMLQVASSISR